MILTIHQPEHLPWLGFFHKMASAESYVFMDNVQYRHQYFQNRNRIQGVHDAIWLNVPIMKHQSRYGAINEQLIDNTQAWRQKYWASIEYQYHRYPFFNHYAEALKAILMTPFDFLVDLNYALIDFFREALEISNPMVKASALGVEGQRSELIYDICRKMNADVFISGPTGREYLDESLFQGMEVRYHEFVHPLYPQFGKKTFTPQLSTLDLLMNCGPDSRRVLMSPFSTALGSAARPSLGAS